MSDSKRRLGSFKDEILQALDIKGFYQQHIADELKQEYKEGWSNLVHCPIHNDTSKPNLQVNLENGGFRCHACGCKGSVFDFWCYVNNRNPKDSFVDALKALSKLTGVKLKKQAPVPGTNNGSSEVPKKVIDKEQEVDSSTSKIPESTVDVLTKNLQPDHYKYLSIHRGLNDRTITKRKIGFDPEIRYKHIDGEWKYGRFSIPIPNRKKEWRNIRLYTPYTDSEYKMINTTGRGTPPRLYPIDEITKETCEYAVICEGEFDALKLNQELEEAKLSDTWGAVSSTHGCKTFEESWLPDFYNKHVVIIFDLDDAGRAAASNIATHFFLHLLTIKKIKSLKIVSPPKLDGTHAYKDITDYFVKLEGTIEELLSAIKNTQPLQSSGPEFGEASEAPLIIEDFVQCIKDREYIDKRVQVPITISGQSNKTYHATRTFKVIRCPVQKSEGQCCSEDVGVQSIPLGHPLFIRSSMASQSQVNEALRKIACTEDKRCTVTEVEKVVMEEYFAHQVVKRLIATRNNEGRNINTQEMVVAPVYILQPPDNIEISPQNYTATGYVRSHPVTRQATLFVEHLEPLDEDWKTFELNEEAITHLKRIQEYDNVKQILDEITLGVTRIYESDEILLSVLLSYLSPLWMVFNNEFMRGWLNICIIGDSGTGKSKTYEAISNWLDLGDLFSALSGTRTGLIYTIKQKGVEWYVQIGRYVMASGKILAIDEVQELDADEVKKMAIAMDQGWLEVSQVASGGYSTKVRTLFLMNPKRGKKISDFPYGCQALAECFHPMFIRRIDLAVFTAGKDEVDFYNKMYEEQEVAEIKIKAADLRTLVYWAWTRDENNIHWDKEATKCCLEMATETAITFGFADDIPLVSPQDFRNNLARLSTAFAILDGSFTDDYQGVIVKPKHVKSMTKIVDVIYSSSNCNLRQYSKNSKKKKTLVDFDCIVETYTGVIKRAKESKDRRWSEGQHFLQMLSLLQNQQFIRKADLADQLGVGRGWVQKHVSYLQMYDLVEMDRSGYRITRKFNLFMSRWQEDEKIAEMFDEINQRIGQLAMLSEESTFLSNPTEYEDEDPFS